MTKQEAWHELNLFVNLKSAPLISRLNEALDALKPPPDEPPTTSRNKELTKRVEQLEVLLMAIQSRLTQLEDDATNHRSLDYHHSHEHKQGSPTRITPNFVVPKPDDTRPYPYNQTR